MKPRDFLDALMPMSLLYDDEGKIFAIGATLKKLRGEEAFIGRDVRDVFSVRDNGRGAGQGPIPVFTKLYLQFRNGQGVSLKGVAAPAGALGGNILNLSFGISVVDAVEKFQLTSGDFAHTDLAIELLYLVEAKSAVLEEIKQLNMRLQNAKHAAEQQALTDGMTGLGNRRAMDLELQRLVQSGQSFALMHADLDLFKNVNDTFGHAAGDAVLCKVAEILLAAVRREDFVARVGGDEFVILLPNFTNEDSLTDRAQKIIRQVERPILFEQSTCKISCSIGITTTKSYQPPTADQMIHDADRALYASKRRGRGRATLFASALRPNFARSAHSQPMSHE